MAFEMPCLFYQNLKFQWLKRSQIIGKKNCDTDFRSGGAFGVSNQAQAQPWEEKLFKARHGFFNFMIIQVTSNSLVYWY